MPTYSYRCTSCGHQFDTVQKFSDAPLTDCPECGEALKKVFHPAGVVFKGSGWYITDSRGSGPSSTASSSKKSDDSPASSPTTESSTPAESTKAAAD